MRMLKSDEFFDKKVRDQPPEAVAATLYSTILGREPESPESQKGAAKLIATAGWQTQVDVMINSEEYLNKFGDDTVPERVAAADKERAEETSPIQGRAIGIERPSSIVPRRQDGNRGGASAGSGVR